MTPRQFQTRYQKDKAPMETETARVARKLATCGNAAVVSVETVSGDVPNFAFLIASDTGTRPVTGQLFLTGQVPHLDDGQGR
jgi:hypothetical protein